MVDQHQIRLQKARSYGVDEVARCNEAFPDSHVEKIKHWTGGQGVDVTIEATGSPEAVKEGIAMTRDGGRFVIVGHYSDTGSVPINPHVDINRKHLEIRGVWGCELHHFYRMIQVLDRHDGDLTDGRGWEDMISHRYGLQEVNEALAAIEEGSVIKAVVEPRKDGR